MFIVMHSEDKHGPHNAEWAFIFAEFRILIEKKRVQKCTIGLAYKDASHSVWR